MTKAPPPPEFSTRRGTGAIVLAGVDGRSLMARRFREIVTGIERDLGGDLTEAQKHLVAVEVLVPFVHRNILCPTGAECCT